MRERWRRIPIQNSARRKGGRGESYFRYRNVCLLLCVLFLPPSVVLLECCCWRWVFFRSMMMEKSAVCLTELGVDMEGWLSWRPQLRWTDRLVISSTNKIDRRGRHEESDGAHPFHFESSDWLSFPSRQMFEKCRKPRSHCYSNPLLFPYRRTALECKIRRFAVRELRSWDGWEEWTTRCTISLLFV